MTVKSGFKDSIIICHPSKFCVRRVLKHVKNRDFLWVYLGEDISKFLMVKKLLKGKGKHLSVGEKLQEVAKSLRQPYMGQECLLCKAGKDLLDQVEASESGYEKP